MGEVTAAAVAGILAETDAVAFVETDQILVRIRSLPAHFAPATELPSTCGQNLAVFWSDVGQFLPTSRPQPTGGHLTTRADQNLVRFWSRTGQFLPAAIRRHSRCPFAAHKVVRNGPESSVLWSQLTSMVRENWKNAPLRPGVARTDLTRRERLLRGHAKSLSESIVDVFIRASRTGSRQTGESTFETSGIFRRSRL